jgi:hypothetical protein
VHVHALAREARALVDLDRALVERRHGESEALGREAPAPEVEAGGQEGVAEPAAREVGAEPEADLERAPFRLEGEVTDELASPVMHAPVGVAAKRRIEQFTHVVHVGRPVVEGVRLRVVPLRDHFRVLLAEPRERERAVDRRHARGLR